MTIKIPLKKSASAVVTAEPQMHTIVKLDSLGAANPPSRAVGFQSLEPEDEYTQFYLGGTRSIGAILPPYDLRTLDRLSLENNSLSPCIEAMVTNVDGTGFQLVKESSGSGDVKDSTDDKNIQELWDFFKEPWPGQSFVTQRKALRRDIKRTGNGYLEVLRTLAGTIAFTKNVDSKMMRLIKLGEQVPAKIAIRRNGKDINMTVMMRYRIFVQMVNGINLRYFKEFGCPLDLDKFTGKWADPDTRLPANRRATEMLHFIDIPDAYTPYGVPSWIGQLPSVLGSRKAEEYNLDFFDNGGIPPVLLLLSGGVLSTETKKALEQRAVQGSASKKNRVTVVEMEPSGGSIDSTSTAKVTVERFGAERQNDSMFEKYDDKCEVRIRRGFRLPPIFVGAAQDYSFAVAYASYTVGEAQVFRPERDEFDEIMSVRLIPAMGYKGYRMKSNPMTIEDATLKLQALEIAQTTGQVDAEEILDAINDTVGTDLKISSTLMDPQSLALSQIQGPPIKAIPGGSAVSPAGKMGIKVPPSPSKTTQAGKQVAGKKTTAPKATPAKQPAVRKEEDEDLNVEDLATMLFNAVKSDDSDGIVEALREVRKLDEDGNEELRDLLIDMQLTTGIKLVMPDLSSMN